MEILDKVSRHALKVLGQINPAYTYHCIGHTYEVVTAAKKIGHECGLDSKGLQIVLIAAWFHDTGFAISPYNHEDHSAKIARQFLESVLYPIKCLNKVVACIRATKLPQQPKNILEAVLCDADMYHLTERNYWEKNLALRRELEFINQEKIRDDHWCHENLNFLAHHHYHTIYGKNVLSKNKQRQLNHVVPKFEALKIR